MIDHTEEVLGVQLTNKPFAFAMFEPSRNVHTTALWLPESTHVRTIGNVELYRRTSADENGFTEWYFVIDKDQQHTRYVVKLADVKMPPLRAACQVGVWVDRTFGSSVRLAPAIFWDVLFHAHDMISDEIQTEFGQRFWVGRVAEAFSKDLCVYCLKVRGGKIKDIVRIRNQDQFNQMAHEIWGPDLSARRVRLAITKNPLRFGT